VLAFEAAAAGQVGVALFTSDAALLAGTPSRSHLCGNNPLIPSGERTPVAKTYGAPTVLTAVYSQRGGLTTVDVVLQVRWTDAAGRKFPAYALLSALSPAEWSEPDWNTFYSFDGHGGYDNSAAGAAKWNAELQKTTAGGLEYSGSSMAYVPCGVGCADARDRAGGNVGGMPGTVKLSFVGGVSNTSRSVLSLWAWDSIVQVAWLWPSGFGTMQGGFNKAAIDLTPQLPSGLALAPRSDPKVAVLPCPTNASARCLWVAVTVAAPKAKAGQMSFVKLLETQQPAIFVPKFAPRYRVRMPPPVDSTRARRQVAGGANESAITRAGLTLINDSFKLTVTATGSGFDLADLVGASKFSRHFLLSFRVISAAGDPGLTDLKDSRVGTSGSILLGIVAPED